MVTLVPFADDAASISIDKLTIENATDRVALYGSLDITRDQTGLAAARKLKALLEQVVEVLEREPRLAAAVDPSAPAKTVRNPFA